MLEEYFVSDAAPASRDPQKEVLSRKNLGGWAISKLLVKLNVPSGRKVFVPTRVQEVTGVARSLEDST